MIALLLRGEARVVRCKGIHRQSVALCGYRLRAVCTLLGKVGNSVGLAGGMVNGASSMGHAAPRIVSRGSQ